MTFAKIILGITLIICVGGFVFLATVNVPVEQTQVTKAIPNDRIFDHN
jgi:hypothetical protein